jgi:hypothetical protein
VDEETYRSTEGVKKLQYIQNIFYALSEVPLRGIRGLFSPLGDSGGRENEIDLTRPLQMERS